ncbi:MAG: ATP synthase F0 subunit B [Bacteroidetes bacterium GWF2_43_63]|nr:MAG: ATP synthase F0 subunit B [Bacteroidetes bacterium GWE2_42_42]OFY54089.1 MAG: ATP synthase F0 subunit B [Bacteroidetes bacterium GWF2_43_63]HBG69731.1 ATP synthase F0 subunit B [Bacteroidales bacterium]HCB61107.1 ATP synthase F0 subunit B [Bacteroidales bacterium]HCY23407.1 ATP synthase F0 subunit B [Bacteroidales bacterium]
MLTTPGLGLILWTTVVFLLLVLLLSKFAWKPIVAAIKKRNEAIDSALQAAETARKEMSQLQVNNEQLLKEAQKERDIILAEARKMRDKIVEEAGVKAREETERIIATAQENIHFEKMAAITELKNQVAVLSLEIAEKIIQINLSSDAKQQELAQKMASEISFN